MKTLNEIATDATAQRRAEILKLATPANPASSANLADAAKLKALVEALGFTVTGVSAITTINGPAMSSVISGEELAALHLDAAELNLSINVQDGESHNVAHLLRNAQSQATAVLGMQWLFIEIDKNITVPRIATTSEAAILKVPSVAVAVEGALAKLLG